MVWPIHLIISSLFGANLFASLYRGLSRSPSSFFFPIGFVGFGALRSVYCSNMNICLCLAFTLVPYQQSTFELLLLFVMIFSYEI